MTRATGHTDVLHGVRVADPYRWLEDSGAPESREWIASQNRFTEDWLRDVPGQADLRERLKALHAIETVSSRGGSTDARAGWIRRGSRDFYQLRGGGRDQPVLYVRDAGAAPRALLDPNKLPAGGIVAIAGWWPSPDGKLLAYSLSKSGSDWQEFFVRDAATGADLPDKIEWAKFTRAAWSRDGKGFYYGRYDKPAGNTLTAKNDFHKLYYHRLGDPQSSDKLIHERPEHKDWLFSAEPTEDGRFVLINSAKGSLRQDQWAYIDLSAGGPAKPLIGEFYAAHDFLGVHQGKFVFLTNWNAPKGRVVSVDPGSPGRERWNEIVPETADTLTAATLDGGELALHYLKDAVSAVRLLTLATGKFAPVNLPANSRIFLSAESTRLFSVGNYTMPATIFECGGPGKCKPQAAAKLPFDPAAFETSLQFYQSTGGARVPLFVVHRKGVKLDGSNPTLLYGYGGFTITVTPASSARYTAWMEMGGVVAVAGLRGGSEYGEAWHAAGMKDKKQNVFDDFIHAAEYLIARKYTNPSKLAILGGSNGGLLVGACVNQRPDLFGAAVPAVGVMDMLRFHKFTIGGAWTPEYGSPDNPEEFKTLRAYSPLHNVRKGAKYPAVLVLTGDHDDRVVPGHSFKYAAAMQAAQGGPAPVLIRIATDAGHGAGKPVSKTIDEDVAVLSFLRKALSRPDGNRQESLRIP